jgi:hypothetical protein
VAIQVILSERAKTNIVTRIMEDSDFYIENTNLRYLRPTVRKMMIEAINATIEEVNSLDPNVKVRIIDVSMKKEEDDG